MNQPLDRTSLVTANACRKARRFCDAEDALPLLADNAIDDRALPPDTERAALLAALRTRTLLAKARGVAPSTITRDAQRDLHRLMKEAA